MKPLVLRLCLLSLFSVVGVFPTAVMAETAASIRQQYVQAAQLMRQDFVPSAKCQSACHAGASDGRFSEHDLRLPELSR